MSDVETNTVVVVSGGDPPAASAARRLPEGAFVIAADAGIVHGLALGLEVGLAVGDMDSVTAEGLEAVSAAGARIESHPRAKDQTDLELALDRAVELGARRLVVLGSDGGRLDHLLGLALLLGLDRYAAVSIEARLGPTRVTVVRSTSELHGHQGDIVSLLPVHGGVEGVTTAGLVYPLLDEDLAAGTTRGISNEMAGPVATVHLRQGVLLALQPGAV